mmetsp:Transcript_55358/g.132223  ORF Transcript_55358/g.132223 Transcript_55358/m.132223 type:complete len:217 (+) Transcript_55358:130-780(+)
MISFDDLSIGSHSFDSLCLLHNCVGLLNGGDVHQLAVQGNGAKTLLLGLLHRFQNTSGLLHFSFPRAENLVRQSHLAGMDRPFSLHAQGSSTFALSLVAVGVRDVAERPVNGSKAVGTCCHHNPRHGVVPGVPPKEVSGLVAVLVCQHPIELVRSANVCGSRLGGCCIVRHAKVEGLVPLGSCRNLVNVHHTQGGFDDKPKSDFLLATHELLHLAD